MIPYADMFNHNEKKCLNHYIVNKSFEMMEFEELDIETKKKIINYKIKKNNMDFSIFDEKKMTT